MHLIEVGASLCFQDYVHKKLHPAEVRAELVRFTSPEAVYADEDDSRGQISAKSLRTDDNG